MDGSSDAQVMLEPAVVGADQGMARLVEAIQTDHSEARVRAMVEAMAKVGDGALVLDHAAFAVNVLANLLLASAPENRGDLLAAILTLAWNLVDAESAAAAG